MVNAMINLLAVFFLLVGLFFMFVGALGVWRMPDLYGRLHANTKCLTLGLIGLLLAAMLYLSLLEDVPMVSVITRGVLVIVFQFVAAPVGAHLLSRGAHLDQAPLAKETLSDELREDLPSNG